MKLRRLLPSGAVVALMAATITVIGPATPSTATATPIQVLVTAGLSSPYLAANAQMSVDAVKASAALVNARGGILGHPIHVTVVDDAGDPTTAVTLLQQAVSGSTPPSIYINSGPANLAAATLPILTSDKILSFNIGPTSNSSDPRQFPYNFDMSPSTTNYAIAFCPYVKAHGGKSVGIIYGADAYGTSLAQMMRTDCMRDHIKVVGVQSFQDTALDATPELLALKVHKPSYLLFEGYGSVVGYVLQDISKINWKVPILGDTAVAATASVVGTPPSKGGLLGTKYLKSLKFLVFRSTVYTKKQRADVTRMINGINAQCHCKGNFPSSLILAEEYAALPLVAAAANAVKSIEPAALARALTLLKPGSVPNTGEFPAYYFRSSSHAPNEPPSAFSFASPSALYYGQYDNPAAH